MTSLLWRVILGLLLLSSCRSSHEEERANARREIIRLDERKYGFPKPSPSIERTTWPNDSSPDWRALQASTLPRCAEHSFASSRMTGRWSATPQPYTPSTAISPRSRLEHTADARPGRNVLPPFRNTAHHRRGRASKPRTPLTGLRPPHRLRADTRPPAPRPQTAQTPHRRDQNARRPVAPSPGPTPPACS